MSRIEERTLACGMKLVVECMPSVRSAAMAWLMPAGSAFDPPDRLGASAVWSEVLLRGAGGRDSRQHAAEAERLGASRGVGADGWMFRLGTTLLGEHLTEALPLFVDMVRAPRMPEDGVEASKALALQGLESLRDDPQQRAVLAARARHLPEPLNRTGMGTPEGIAALTRSELMDGWLACARPVGAVFAAAGDVDADALEADLNRHLESWDGAATAPVVGDSSPRGYGHEEDDSNQVQIVVVHDAPAPREEACVLEQLAVGVLSGGMAGRLFTEVREKRGLCYSVHAGYRTLLDRGVGSAYVGTTPERAQESLDVLFAELHRLREGVDAEEFERAKVGIKAKLIFSGESTSGRAGALASDVLKRGRARSLEEIAGEFDSVTLEGLNRYLEGRDLGRMTIQTLGPSPLKPPAG